MYNYQCPSCGLRFSLPQYIGSPKCPSCGQTCMADQSNGGAGDYTSGMNGQQYYGYNSNYREPDLFENGPSGKSRGLAGLFAILLGGLGIHYFYMDKVAGGIICILLSLVTCGLWYFVTLIQGIMILTLKQAEFEHKYINSTTAFPLF